MIALLTEHDSSALIAFIGVISIWLQLKTKRDTRQINNAVNHAEEGEPPMVQRVRSLEAHKRWEIVVLRRFAVHLGVELPDHPDETSEPVRIRRNKRGNW